jgi:hypothetical protein
VARRSTRRRSSEIGRGGAAKVNPQLQLRQRTCHTPSSFWSGSIASGSLQEGQRGIVLTPAATFTVYLYRPWWRIQSEPSSARVLKTA